MMKHNKVVEIGEQSVAHVLKALRDERNQLKIALAMYGRHTLSCVANVNSAGECACGWRAMAKKWRIKE